MDRRPMRAPTRPQHSRGLFSATMSTHNRHRGSNPLEAPNQSTQHMAAEQEDPNDSAIVPKDEQGNYMFETALLALSPSMQYRDLAERKEEEAQIAESEEKILEAWRKGSDEVTDEDIKPLLQSLLEKHMESYEADRWMFEPDESKKNA